MTLLTCNNGLRLEHSGRLQSTNVILDYFPLVITASVQIAKKAARRAPTSDKVVGADANPSSSHDARWEGLMEKFSSWNDLERLTHATQETGKNIVGDSHYPANLHLQLEHLKEQLFHYEQLSEILQVEITGLKEAVLKNLGSIKDKLNQDGHHAEPAFVDELRNLVQLCINSVGVTEKPTDILEKAMVEAGIGALSFTNIVRTLSHEQDRSCYICKKVFASDGSLKTHICKSHFKLKDHRCCLCSEEFYSSNSLLKHQIYHDKSEYLKVLNCSFIVRLEREMKNYPCVDLLPLNLSYVRLYVLSHRTDKSQLQKIYNINKNAISSFCGAYGLMNEFAELPCEISLADHIPVVTFEAPNDCPIWTNCEVIEQINSIYVKTIRQELQRNLKGDLRQCIKTYEDSTSTYIK